MKATRKPDVDVNQEELELIDEILAWSENNTNFDPSFVVTMREKLLEWGELTENQRGAINKIKLRWVDGVRG